MGKPKLGVGSSIKAMFNIKPPGPKTMATWPCAQQSKTDSFREVYKSFNSMYYSSISSSSSPTATAVAAAAVIEEESIGAAHFSPLGEESFSGAFQVCCSSSLSGECSSSSTTNTVPTNATVNERFFFSPCTTKSIMATEREQEEEKEKGRFCRESRTLAMSSEDPYMDFRSSMEEMVVAHGLADLPSLQELLHCYLRLNDKSAHKFIVLAFVDLLITNFMEDEKVRSSHPSCLCLDDEKGNEGKG